ncbi:MAG: hypothetical protein IJZ72_08940 [Oscillospiraceae bacterium]|nr:hypothetical protein [Oscillospiraceae bacterium]
MDARGIKIVNRLVTIGLVTLNGWLLVRKNRWAAFVQCDEKHSEYLPALSVMTGCIACFTDFLTAETVTITVRC